MHGKVGGMHDTWCAWWGACVAGCVCGSEACMAEGVYGRGACMAHGVHGGGGHVWWVVCVAAGHAWQGGSCVSGETATAADGTHPTGMYSCLFFVLKYIEL